MIRTKKKTRRKTNKVEDYYVPKLKTQKTPKRQKAQSGFSHKKYLNKQEIERLDKVLHRNFYKDQRNVLIIFTALHSGARAQEILNLNKDDLLPHCASILIKTLKGGKPREIPLPKWLFRALSAIETDETGLLFPISYSRLYQVWKDYSPCQKSFHALRHTFAINLYARHKDLRLVQVALGHSNIQNTMIYAEYYYSTQELRRKIVSSNWRWF